MEGNPVDAPISEEFAGFTFYAEKLKKARARLSELRSMTYKEAREKSETEYRDKINYWEDEKQKAEVLFARYTTLQEEIKQWKPPTTDHEKLKNFAINQLEISKPDPKWYSKNIPKKLSAEEWLEREIIDCSDKIKRYKIDARKEEENKWIKDLRESLENM